MVLVVRRYAGYVEEEKREGKEGNMIATMPMMLR